MSGIQRLAAVRVVTCSDGAAHTTGFTHVVRVHAGQQCGATSPDAVKAGEHFLRFHLDLIPRLDLGANLAYMDEVFSPLTPAYEAGRYRGSAKAHLSPRRQHAIGVSWMLANRGIGRRSPPSNRGAGLPAALVPSCWAKGVGCAGEFARRSGGAQPAQKARLF